MDTWYKVQIQRRFLHLSRADEICKVLISLCEIWQAYVPDGFY